MPTTSPQPPAPLAPDLASLFMLDTDITFLNHGCFGAVMQEVFDAQTELRRTFEARPIEMLDRRGAELIGEAADAVGAFVGAKGADLGFVTNATEGINAVIRSLTFDSSDELLTTTHVYNAVRQTMRYVAENAGASYRELDLPLPIASDDDVLGPIEAALTPRTRLFVVDHVTSPTAVIFPVERIVKLCADRGVDVLIDGAHVPGMLAVDVESIGAAYYAANLHKWTCAPKGCAFLWVRPDRQAGLHPPTISHFLGEGLVREFGWQGTRDVTAWLSARVAIAAMDRAIGWDRVREHNHRLATWMQAMLCERWGAEPATPLDGALIGSMAAVRAPDGARRFETFEAFQAALYDRHHIEVPLIDWGGHWWIRPSCQVYNRADQYERLGEAVLELAG